MSTPVLDVRSLPVCLLALLRGAAVLRQGDVFDFPTATVYGPGANALDRAALARIFQNRPR